MIYIYNELNSYNILYEKYIYIHKMYRCAYAHRIYTSEIILIAPAISNAPKALVLGATGLAVQQALDPFGALVGRQLGVSTILVAIWWRDSWHGKSLENHPQNFYLY
jgi:hypothetical protein